MENKQYTTQQIDTLRLLRSTNIGPVNFKQLIKLFRSPTDALKALPGLALKGGQKKIFIPSKNQAIQELEDVQKIGGFTIFYNDSNYPPYLKLCPDSPIILHGLGNSKFLNNSKIFSIVGSRQASAHSRTWAYEIAKELGELTYTIVSGAAIGIDRAAHKGGLPHGTIGVIGCGLDKIYPASNKDLYDIIQKKGCLLSEYPVGTSPLAKHFPQRNRIIAGLSLGVLLIEASLHSGSLITSRYALHYGREVFAMPGPPTDTRSQGSNQLIKDGAHLVTDVDDIISILQYDSHLESPKSFLSLDDGEDSQDLNNDVYTIIEKSSDNIEEIFNLISFQPINLETLNIVSHISYKQLHVILLQLELAGRIEKNNEGKYLRLPS